MKLLKNINAAVTAVLALVLVAVLMVSGYVLWSNNKTYQDARNVFNELLSLKPETDDSGNLAAGFEGLRKINSDIRAWLTVNNTRIDYPVVKAGDNVYYMSRDIYRNPSLAGSIFLDYRNSGYFDQRYLVMYGHHMENGLMFGDLDLFLDPDFFNENRTAVITTEEGIFEFRVLALLITTDSDDVVFAPDRYDEDLSDLYRYLKENALLSSDSVMDEFSENTDSSQVAALVTCTDGPTGSRLVLFVYRTLISEDTDTGTDEPTETTAPETDEPTDTSTPATETDEPTDTSTPGTETDEPTDTTTPETETDEPTDTSTPGTGEVNPSTGESKDLRTFIVVMFFCMCGLVLLVSQLAKEKPDDHKTKRKW